MQVVKKLADTLSTHTHSGIAPGNAITQPPAQASAITNHGTQSSELKTRLDPISQ